MQPKVQQVAELSLQAVQLVQNVAAREVLARPRGHPSTAFALLAHHATVRSRSRSRRTLRSPRAGDLQQWQADLAHLVCEGLLEVGHDGVGEAPSGARRAQLLDLQQSGGEEVALWGRVDIQVLQK